MYFENSWYIRIGVIHLVKIKIYETKVELNNAT